MIHKRLGALIVALVFGLAGCGSGVAEVTEPVHVPSKAAAEDTPVSQEDAPHGAAQTAPTPTPTEQSDPVTSSGRYTWTVSARTTLAPESAATTMEDVISVQVDRNRKIALFSFNVNAMPDDMAATIPSTRAVAFVDGVQLARGFDKAMLNWSEEGEPDPDHWYEAQLAGTSGLPDILVPDGSVEGLYASIGLDSATQGRVSISAEDIDTNLWLEVDADEAGQVAAIRLGYPQLLSEHEEDVISIRVDHGTPPFDVPSREDATVIMHETRPRGEDFTTVEPDPVADALSGERDVALRLNAYGQDLDVVLTPEYRLIQVTQSDILAGTDDFRFWQLTRTGAERVLRRALDNPAVSSGVYNISYRTSVALDIGGGRSELNAGSSHADTDVDYTSAIDNLVAGLADPTWLGDDIVSGPQPWTPQTLTVVATPLQVDVIDASWPMPVPIREMGTAGEGIDGEIVVCLEGVEVEPVWALLDGSVNRAHLRLHDGEPWDANVMINWPGYRLISDPCGPDYELYQQRTAGG